MKSKASSRPFLRALGSGVSLLMAIVLGSCSSPAPMPPPQAMQMPSQQQPGDYEGGSAMRQFVGGINGPSNIPNGAPLGRANSVLLIDAHTGQELAGRNADVTRPVASTQKLLTALVVIAAGDLDRNVVVQPEDVRVQPTVLGVRPGEVYTRRNLLTAMLVKSTNDVAQVLARDNAGSLPAFAERMNAFARSVGCTNSHFVNPHGLDASGQYSTARDMAHIAMAAYHNPVIRNITRRQEYTFVYSSGRATHLENTNKILPRMPECNGMKTGYTTNAGRCLISSAGNGNRDLIAVQLGTETRYIWDDGEALMRWGFEHGGGNRGRYYGRAAMPMPADSMSFR